MFLEPDEHIIIMEEWQRLFSADDFKQIEDCGIKTVFLQNTFGFERPPSITDDRINLVLGNTKLKILLPFFNFPPSGYEFWVKNYAVDYNNPEVGTSIDSYVKEIIKKYSNDRIQAFYAMYHDGEFPWCSKERPPNLSDETIINFVTNRQRIFVTQHNEIWTTFHNGMGGHEELVAKINHALHTNFPDAQHYILQFEYFLDWGEYIYEAPKKYFDLFGAKTFVGSGFIEGLQTNFDKAIKYGVWGFLTAPMHPFTRHHSIENWMHDIIRNTNEKMIIYWSNIR